MIHLYSICKFSKCNYTLQYSIYIQGENFLIKKDGFFEKKIDIF